MSGGAALEHASDAELLGLRFSELGLRLETTPLVRDVQRLARELEARGLCFRPHVWLSTDFFSPDGVPGFALPFFLAHPRLARLERAQVAWVEGASATDRMRLLRHEAGHAFDTAYALSRRRDWREVFGRRSAPYRRTYAADPTLRTFVRHLPGWYAQSHPAEDFAETFAVWLARGRSWTGAPGAEKLARLDTLVRDVADRPPPVRKRERPWSLPSLDTTLGEHYAEKRRRRARESHGPYARFLERSFPSAGRLLQRSSAARWLLERERAVARRLPAPFRGDRYSARQVLEAMALRCRELGLRLQPGGRAPTLAETASTVADTLRALRRARHLLTR